MCSEAKIMWTDDRGGEGGWTVCGGEGGGEFFLIKI